jgi:hypothetical protein
MLVSRSLYDWIGQRDERRPQLVSGATPTLIRVLIHAEDRPPLVDAMKPALNGEGTQRPITMDVLGQ